MTLTKVKLKVKANVNNYTRQKHKVKHNYYNKTNYFIESGDSCSRLQRSCRFHRGQCHERLVRKRFWRALDAYSGDHGKVDKGSLFGIPIWGVMTGTWGLAFGWPCQFWKVGMMILVHTWLVVETVGDVG